MDKLQHITRFNVAGFTKLNEIPESDGDQFTSILTNSKDNAKGESALSNSLRELQSRYANSNREFPSTQSILENLQALAKPEMSTSQLEASPTETGTLKNKLQTTFETRFVSIGSANSITNSKHEIVVQDETIQVIEE